MRGKSAWKERALEGDMALWWGYAQNVGGGSEALRGGRGVPEGGDGALKEDRTLEGVFLVRVHPVLEGVVQRWAGKGKLVEETERWKGETERWRGGVLFWWWYTLSWWGK